MTPEDKRLMDLVGVPEKDRQKGAWREDREPTTSVDDALWLAEKAGVKMFCKRYSDGKARVGLEDGVAHHGTTLPLAICAAIEAAVKARKPDPMTLEAGEELDRAVCEAVFMCHPSEPSQREGDCWSAVDKCKLFRGWVKLWQTGGDPPYLWVVASGSNGWFIEHPDRRVALCRAILRHCQERGAK